ncbi:MAG: AbrB/MazE/SpoVT family DNA-binding domain-containing protein [Cyanobacteria bacterium J06642_3]
MNKPTKLTTKYQATIPKEVRVKLDLKAGDHIMFVEKEGEIVIQKVKGIDWQYLQAVSPTLEPEWLSDEDEQAYADL